jgi:hypothetical protein
MPAARNCANCGTALSGDVRWCGLCAAPVRELTPRAPLHHGDLVGVPIATGGFRPHWSRWEKSATTFGPWGRILATILFFCSLPLGISFGLVLYAIWFPVVAVVFLSAVWAKGWVIPGAPPPPPRHQPSAERVTTPPEPRSRVEVVWRATKWGIGAAAFLLFVYGPPPLRVALIALGTLIGVYWFFRSFLT